MFRSRLFLAAVGAVALTLATPTSAPAHGGAVVSDPIATGLVGPLQIDLGHHGSIYVAQSFSGTVSKVRADGTVKDLLNEPAGVDGVSAGRHGVAYTTTDFDPATRNALIKLRKNDGSIVTVADLWPYEQANNPDAGNTYGFLDLTPACAAQVDAIPGEDAPDGSPYQGIPDSHPYALAKTRHGWYVADAGMNAILHVSRGGVIRTVAVLPPQPVKVTADGAAALGMPACTVGATFAFEPVPTDVEIGHGGKLVVSLLPGGPEDPSLGARGSVWKVNPWSGKSHQIGSNFLGATNVALGDHGDIYVAELFGNKVSRLGWNGHNKTIAELNQPAGLEYRDGKLYVSYDVFPPEQGPPDGKIAKIRLGRSYHHGHRH